jgi:hypothetical protein
MGFLPKFHGAAAKQICLCPQPLPAAWIGSTGIIGSPVHPFTKFKVVGAFILKLHSGVGGHGERYHDIDLV